MRVGIITRVRGRGERTRDEFLGAETEKGMGGAGGGDGENDPAGVGRGREL